MRPTRKTWLVLLAAGAGLVTWLAITFLRTRMSIPTLATWPVCAVLLAVAGIVFSMGWQVRQYLKGKVKQLDQLRAARTAALAKSASLGGALLLGFYGAQAVIAYTDTQPALHAAMWVTGAAALCSIVVAVVGLIVEGFCKLPPPTDADSTTVRPAREQPGEA